MWDSLWQALRGDFMPHGHCYLWTPALVALEVGSNATIGLAYVSISLSLYYMIRRIRDVPFSWMYLAFGVFIITCGGTHFTDVVTVWNPIYWFDAGLRVVTAAASLGTAVLLVPLVPKAVSLAADAQLARERSRELADTYQELERAHEKTKDLERLKTQFFANVSHELRTPLALILGPAERLARAANLTADQRRDLEVIARNGATLLRHVNDLLDVSKLEAGKIEPQYVETDLAQIVRLVASNFEGLAIERRMTLTVEAPQALPIEADDAEITRVVANLVSNAFKFTPAGGRVRCAVRAAGDRATLEIADSGPGVRAQDRAIIFERFVQAEGGSARPYGGTGLGLAIVKDFVSLHGGSVEVGGAPEGGALFTVTLPLSAPEGTPVAPAPSRRAPAQSEAIQRAVRDLQSRIEAIASSDGDDGRPLVLIVEDNPDMNRFVRETLADDYRTAAAFDGREGIDKALSLRPDLIVSDVMMPSLSGDELVTTLRADPRCDSVPIMLLTAKADEELRVRMLRAGAQDYLMKPFSAEELTARAANLVTMKRVRDVLQTEMDAQVRDLEKLAREVTQRKRDLGTALEAMRVAREHAERASQLKTDFLGMVSHELRTPLTALSMQLERLLRGNGQELDDAQRMLVGRMQRSTGRLTELVESLLEYASMQSGRVRTRAVDLDLADVVRAAVDDARGPAEEKGLGLRLTLEPSMPALRSDPRLVRLVVTNLVQNAIKFTQRGSVDVRVSAAGTYHRVSVVDTGPGIPREEQARIFQPFVQLEPRERKHTPGVGLGLAIVRDLVTALGGELALDSELGRGSTFTVDLPPLA